MRLRSSTILGLSFDERGIRCAEVEKQGTRRLVRKLGRFTFPDNAPLSDPAACGAVLKSFLHSHGFTATQTVIGVPARWLIAQDRELPPSDRAATIDILRLQGERMSPGGGAELVVDVAGDIVPNVASRTLIVGILRPQLDRLIALAEAAELDLVSVTASSLAMHAAIGAADRGEALLLLADNNAEVVGANDASSARLLKHVPSVTAGAPASLVQLGSELRRTIALSNLLPAQGSRSLLVWNGIGLADAQVRELGERAGASMKATDTAATSIGVDVSPIALNGDASQLTADAFLPAIALAAMQAAGRRLPVDFLNSRLAPVAARRFGRRTVWGVVIAIVAFVALLALYKDIVDTETRAADLSEQIKKIEPNVKSAKAEIARVAYGRSYFESRPPVLEGLREVTLAFNFNEPIWATSFSLRDNRRGLVQGKTTDQRLALALRDRLAADPKMRDVKLEDLREAGGTGSRGGEQSFSISFFYAGTE